MDARNITMEERKDSTSEFNESRKRLTQIGNSLNRNGSRLDLDPTLLVPRYCGDLIGSFWRTSVRIEDFSNFYSCIYSWN